MVHTVNHRMVWRRRAGSVTLWAWTASAIIHLAIFGVCAVIKSSQSHSTDNLKEAPEAKVSWVRTFVCTEPVMPKPTVKRPGKDRFAAKPAKLLPLSRIFDTATGVPENRQDFAKPAVLASGSSVKAAVLPKGIEFFGSWTDSRKICYLVDCSGSMYGVFTRVKKQLKVSIADLQPDKYFSIIFFGDDRLFEFDDGRLVRATDKSKLRAYTFIDSVRPAGRTNAMAALERAVRIRDNDGACASVIYFLTDGFELTSKDTQQFGRAVAELLDSFAPGTKINTIGFWSVDDDRRILEMIAGQSGGEYVQVTDDTAD